MSHIVYKLEPGSPVFGVIATMEAKWKEFQAAANAFKDKYEASAFVVGQLGVVGLKFDGSAPKGWKKHRKYDFHVPSEAKGNPIRAEFYRLPYRPDAQTFSNLLEETFGGSWQFIDEDTCTFYWTTFRKLGDTTYIEVPAQCKVKPEGGTEVLMSEYAAAKAAAKGN